MRLLAVFLFAGLALPCSAQAAQGTVFIFRRHYAPLTRPSVYLDGTRIARMQSGSFFSIALSVGVHRLAQDRNFHSNPSVNSEEEATDIDVRTSATVCIEMTFADARGVMKHARFTPVPCSIARDHIEELHPLDAKWIFDARISLMLPEFPPAKVRSDGKTKFSTR